MGIALEFCGWDQPALPAAAEYLIRAVGVITAPGSAFMQEGYLRVSFAVPQSELVDGVRAAARAFAALAE